MKVPRDAVTGAEWRAIEEGAVVFRRDGFARFRLTGSGRVECLQGLVTSDLAGAAEGSQLFSALLTNKGMIVSPLWITRTPQDLLVEAPLAASAPLAETLTRSLPPRLCRWEEVTGTTAGLGCYGPRSGELAPEGSVGAVARGAPGAEWVVPVSEAETTLAALTARGALPASPALMEAARILAGIPSLGSEIDDKTLPQEVRLEELGAISYTKGCYLGQETVARVHFRGHANRGLALLLPDAEPQVPDEVRLRGKAVGRLTSAAWSPEVEAWIAQAVLRREIEDGAEVALASAGTALVRRGQWPREP